MNIPEIVSKYRGKKSLRKFAIELSIKMGRPISHQTIKNWEDGIRQPDYYFMVALSVKPDWRRQFALEILAVLKPDYNAPDQAKSIS